MKTTHISLCKAVDRVIKRTLTFKDYTKQIRHFSEMIYREYNIPINLTTDYLNGKKPLNDATEFMLFAILSTLDDSKLQQYFTEKDYVKYANAKYEPEKIKFPLKLPAVMIAEDQWLCAVDAKTLMQFRDAQLIEYNEHTQRTLTRVVRKGKETYKITINRKAIDGIKESYRNGTYIPNTITLNMPEGTEYDYVPTKDGPMLVIEHIEHFDILDGYHRYLAISELFNEDPDFNYIMELRFVSYREEKARQFIWQEDQKTKMSKVDSESFNQYKQSNVIVNRICSGPYSNIIKPKDGIIDAAVLSSVLDQTYLKNKTKLTRSAETQIAMDIEDDFKKLEKYDPTIFDKRWSREFTICIIYCLWLKMKDMDKLIQFSTYAAPKISARFNGRDITRIEKAMEEFECTTKKSKMNSSTTPSKKAQAKTYKWSLEDTSRQLKPMNKA